MVCLDVSFQEAQRSIGTRCYAVNVCFPAQVTRYVVVDYGLTSHSAIFQLYSEGTDVQFPNFDLLPGTHAMGS